MITRKMGFPRLYGVPRNYRDPRAGLIKVQMVKDIPHAWAIARPGGVNLPHAGGNTIVRTPTPTLNMSRPRIAMDPSDPNTWQRQYRF